MDPTPLPRSRVLRAVLLTVAGAIFTLCIFRLGVYVGFRNATTAYRWSQNYHRNFAGPHQGFMEDVSGPIVGSPPPARFMQAHGMFGQVLKIDGNVMIIRDRMGDVERPVVIGNDTVIHRFSETIPLSQISASDSVVIIGAPDDLGRVNARLIRVFFPSL